MCNRIDLAAIGVTFFANRAAAFHCGDSVLIIWLGDSIRVNLTPVRHFLAGVFDGWTNRVTSAIFEPRVDCFETVGVGLFLQKCILNRVHNALIGGNVNRLSSFHNARRDAVAGRRPWPFQFCTVLTFFLSHCAAVGHLADRAAALHTHHFSLLWLGPGFRCVFSFQLVGHGRVLDGNRNANRTLWRTADGTARLEPGFLLGCGHAPGQCSVGVVIADRAGADIGRLLCGWCR